LYVPLVVCEPIAVTYAYDIPPFVEPYGIATMDDPDATDNVKPHCDGMPSLRTIAGIA
jgi:hypothetical protein